MMALTRTGPEEHLVLDHAYRVAIIKRVEIRCPTVWLWRSVPRVQNPD